MKKLMFVLLISSLFLPKLLGQCYQSSDTISSCIFKCNYFQGSTLGFSKSPSDPVFTDCFVRESQWLRVKPKGSKIEIEGKRINTNLNLLIRVIILDSQLNQLSNCLELTDNLQKLSADNLNSNESYLILIHGFASNDAQFELHISGNEIDSVGIVPSIDFFSSNIDSGGIARIDSVYGAINYNWEHQSSINIDSGQGATEMNFSRTNPYYSQICISAESKCGLIDKKCSVPDIPIPPPCISTTPSNIPPSCLMCFPPFLQSSTSGFTPGLPGDSGFPCGTIENNQFISFIPDSTGKVAFTFFNIDCLNDMGLQAVIFDQAFIPVSNCQGVWPSDINSQRISADLIPGEVYWLMIDGYVGDICDFWVSGDGTKLNPPAPKSKNWNKKVCQNQLYDYEIERTNPGDSIYWEITNGTINSGLNTEKVNIVWNNSTTGILCVKIKNECGIGDELCESIVISNPDNPSFSISNNSICTTEPTTITYTGIASPTANFNWNFQNATILSGSGAGPYEISYPTAGGYQISLEVEENGCTSSLTEQTIVVNDRLAPLSVNCSSTVDEITFSWNSVQGATNYRVNSLTGQTGILNGTNYIVSGLSPNEEVSLEIFAESGVGCAASSTTKTCTAQDCPPISVSISPIADICLNQMTAPIQLFAQQNGGAGTGSFTWSGPGITPNGLFAPNASNIGTVQIEARYTEGSCEYSSTQTINVFNSPTASFTADPVVCLGDEATVTYTGNAGNSAIYNWDFGNSIIVSGSGRGPYQILPDFPGDFTISLEVAENGCVSPVESQIIQTDEQLTPPVISCDISTTNSLTFGWNDVSGNAGYSVRVLTGQTGVLTGTNYEVNGLSSGEEVTIELTVLSSNSCPPQLATLTCLTKSCPPIIVSIDPLQMPICFGDSLQIQLNPTLTNSSGNGIFNWSGTGVSSTGILDVSGLPSGNLSINLTYEENGCTYSTNTIVTIQSEIDLDEKILSPIWYPGNSGSVELTVSGGTPPYIFGWSQFPVSELAIRDVPPGEYCVTVIDNVGCAALDCYTIGGGIFRISPLVLMCTGDTKKLSVRPGRGADFNWSPSNGLSYTDCASPNASPSKSTIYNVSAAMPDGRAESTNVAVIVLPPFICNLASAVPEDDFSKILNDYDLKEISQQELFEIENQITDSLIKKEVEVVPNPTTGQVNILSFLKVEKTEVFDFSGRRILISEEAKIDISAFAKGVYFFKIKTEGKIVIKRVVLI